MPTASRKRRSITSSGAGSEIRVTIKPFGPGPDDIRVLAQTVTKSRAVQSVLGKVRFRLLHVNLLDEVAETKPTKLRPPQRFQAVFFDYTNNRTVLATGRLSKPTALEVTESGLQPRPTEEEFQEAVGLIRKHPDLGPLLRSEQIVPYPAMPPLVDEELPDGRKERTIAVGLLPREGMKGHEIVAANMISRKVTRFAPSERGRAPHCSAAHNPICGLPYSGQQTASNVAGSVWVTVTQGGAAVWKFLAVRPAASSGTNGSGVELAFFGPSR